MGIKLNPEDINAPILLVGPSGVGKTYMIEGLAKDLRCNLYNYNCRKDKTLREGRNKLINWVFLSERCIVWLEGADDLTIEAQSFLRRSLETYSKSVILILEVRDTAYLADPLRSRCKTIIVPRPSSQEAKDFLVSSERASDTYADEIISKISPLSYRAVKVYVRANNFLKGGEIKSVNDDNDRYCKITDALKEGTVEVKDILSWKRDGIYPTKLIERAMSELGWNWLEHMPSLARGRNPWYILGYIVSHRMRILR
jgi:DNA polymerase III delta prime subunit